MHLCSTSIIKITVKKMAVSPECFVYFPWDLQNWKEQSSIGMEGTTQLRKSNFEWSKYKWRHQCHAFAKKGTFFFTMSKQTSFDLYFHSAEGIYKLLARSRVVQTFIIYKQIMLLPFYDFSCLCFQCYISRSSCMMITKISLLNDLQ